MNYKYLFHVVLACLIISALPVFAEISPAYLRIGSSMEDSVLVEVSTSGVRVASDIESLEKAEIKPVQRSGRMVSCSAVDISPKGSDNPFDGKVSIRGYITRGSILTVRLSFEGIYKKTKNKWLAGLYVHHPFKSMRPGQSPESATLVKVPKEGKPTLSLRTAVNKKDKSKIDIMATLHISGQKISDLKKNGKQIKVTGRLKNPAGKIVSEQVKDLRGFGYG